MDSNGLKRVKMQELNMSLERHILPPYLTSLPIRPPEWMPIWSGPWADPFIVPRPVRQRPQSIKWLMFSQMNMIDIIYRKISYTGRTKSQNLNVSRLVLHLPRPIPWSQVSSRKWRRSWSSADGRCSNYIWVINNSIAYLGASIIRGWRRYQLYIYI